MHLEGVNEYLSSFDTYAEMKKEPVDDWSFDMDKHVLDDNEIIGYSFYFDSDDPGLLTVDQMNEFLTFAFGEGTFTPIDAFEYPDYEDYYYFKVETTDKKFVVYYTLAEDYKLSPINPFGVESIDIVRTF